MKIKTLKSFLLLMIAITAFSCGTKQNQKSESGNDSISQDSIQSAVLNVYNFHLQNRCASCIAIENATTRTINTYFANELKEGRLVQKIINVDDKTNEAISTKYEMAGSGLLLVSNSKGKEYVVDLTGDGFKYAKNNEEKFIEILKQQIETYLK